ncbi:hypothetical protein EJB05_14897, partial [Eragrostis curvula]
MADSYVATKYKHGGSDCTSNQCNNPMVANNRYDIMRNYMPKVGSLGLDTMFRTCTVQPSRSPPPLRRRRLRFVSVLRSSEQLRATGGANTMDFGISAARWAVSKAMSPIADGFLAWAASNGLGPNVDALTQQLLNAQVMLEDAQDREIRSPTLRKLLLKLRGLAYNADDVLDELDYFHIDNKVRAAGGCVHVNARRAVASKLKEPSTSRRLKFDRVEFSRKMEGIVEQLKQVCAMVSTILNLQPYRINDIAVDQPKTTSIDTAVDQPKTTSYFIPELYGRGNTIRSIVDRITLGEYSANKLTVLAIVGPGGIGKTTFTQHLYHEVKSQFDVLIWVCVSLNFNANRLAHEILKQIPTVEGEKENASQEELIEQRLRNKRFLLVLDDIWNFEEDEWKKLLSPFCEGEGACVFGEEGWKGHDAFNYIGRQIVETLRGSPLAAKIIIDAQECSGSSELPRDINNLLNLEYFLVSDDRLHSGIVEVGKLQHLRKLQRFEVKRETDASSKKKKTNGFELKQLGKLLELQVLGIYNLGNVAVNEEASEANLTQKDRLQELILDWHIEGTEKPMQEDDILECLKPHSNLQKLCIRGHGGTKCPTWLDPTCHQLEEVGNMDSFSNLKELEIVGCPKLSHLPSVPWTCTPCSAKIEGIGSSFEEIDYTRDFELGIQGKDSDLDSTFWNVLAFDNLIGLKELRVEKCPALSFDQLEKLPSLKSLTIYESNAAVWLAENEGRVKYKFPIEYIRMCRCKTNGKELTRLLSYFPRLSTLVLLYPEKITGVSVADHLTMTTTTTSFSSSSANEVEGMQTAHHQQQMEAEGEEEIHAASAAADGLLLLPPQLEELQIYACIELSLHHPNTEAGGTGGGLQGLCCLRSLEIWECPRFLSSNSASSSFPIFFPASLQSLKLYRVEGKETQVVCLSNLTSLTDLSISDCGDLRVEGLWPLLAHGRLTTIDVTGTPNFFVGCESPPQEGGIPPRSSSNDLQSLSLCTDDAVGVLATPICTLLSSSLTTLTFAFDDNLEHFTKEQEEALQRLASLQDLRFWDFHQLQCLPVGLHTLPNLKRLQILFCKAFRSLPKGGLPSSLQELRLQSCSAIQSLPKDTLPSSLQELRLQSCSAIRSLPKDALPSSLQVLEISNCPAIRSLPKVDSLPSSLRELDVQYSDSDELIRQCCKLRGIIPIMISIGTSYLISKSNVRMKELFPEVFKGSQLSSEDMACPLSGLS